MDRQHKNKGQHVELISQSVKSLKFFFCVCHWDGTVSLKRGLRFSCQTLVSAKDKVAHCILVLVLVVRFLILDLRVCILTSWVLVLFLKLPVLITSLLSDSKHCEILNSGSQESASWRPGFWFCSWSCQSITSLLSDSKHCKILNSGSQSLHLDVLRFGLVLQDASLDSKPASDSKHCALQSSGLEECLDDAISVLRNHAEPPPAAGATRESTQPLSTTRPLRSSCATSATLQEVSRQRQRPAVSASLGSTTDGMLSVDCRLKFARFDAVDNTHTPV